MDRLTKRDRLLGHLDLARATGLEIGARDAPLVTRDESQVRYVDYAETEVIRANAAEHAIDPATVLDVDIVWGERPLRECVGAPVDYIVASHVLEHVPDMIGWLEEMHGALRPGGTLALIVPDRRFTFDVLRHDSSLAEMVEAYMLHHRQPSLRQVFDVASMAVGVDAGAMWRGEAVADELMEGTRTRLPGLLSFAKELVAHPRYIDAHCWTFTPHSFLDIAEKLVWLDLFPFAIDAFFSTGVMELEFHLRLLALPPGQSETARASIKAAREALAAAESEKIYLARHAVPMDQPTGHRAAGLALEEAVRRVSGLEERLADAERRLRETEAVFRRSMSWRLTAPLRAAMTLLGRRA